MSVYENLSYADCSDPERSLDLYLPDGKGSCPVLIYIHGGSIENGSSRSKSALLMAEALVKEGIGVACINYRKYPRAKYPEFIEDAAQAIAFVKREIGRYVLPTDIYVCGSSAGAYISMMLCFDDSYLGKHGISPLEISAFIHNSGQPTTHFNVLRQRSEDTRRAVIDSAAPLYYVGKAEKYPPMLFICSDNDMPARYEQTLLTLATLAHFGYPEYNRSFKLLSGTHCEQDHRIEGNGNSQLANIVIEYIGKIQP